VRQPDVSPAPEAESRNGGVALRNADASLIGHPVMLDTLVEALLPLLSTRIEQKPQPGRGAAVGDSPGERTSDTRGARPGHTCSEFPACHVRELPTMVGSFDVNGFYSDVLHAIGEHAQRGGTAFGAAAVVKRVAKGYGLAVADQIGLPRPTRAEREDLAWERKQGRS